jgi:hypothetical protein
MGNHLGMHTSNDDGIYYSKKGNTYQEEICKILAQSNNNHYTKIMCCLGQHGENGGGIRVKLLGTDGQVYYKQLVNPYTKCQHSAEEDFTEKTVIGNPNWEKNHKICDKWMKNYCQEQIHKYDTTGFKINGTDVKEWKMEIEDDGISPRKLFNKLTPKKFGISTFQDNIYHNIDECSCFNSKYYDLYEKDVYIQSPQSFDATCKLGPSHGMYKTENMNIPVDINMCKQSVNIQIEKVEGDVGQIDPNILQVCNISKESGGGVSNQNSDLNVNKAKEKEEEEKEMKSGEKEEEEKEMKSGEKEEEEEEVDDTKYDIGGTLIDKTTVHLGIGSIILIILLTKL